MDKFISKIEKLSVDAKEISCITNILSVLETNDFICTKQDRVTICNILNKKVTRFCNKMNILEQRMLECPNMD